MNSNLVKSLALVAGLSPLPALSATVVEEMIVSSKFRPENLQTVAGSISIVNEAAIKQRAAQNLEEVISLVPNVNFSSAASRIRFYQIRGIGELEQFVDPINNPSVGLMIDGVDLSGIGGASTLFDVDQIEVLRGPQGTRFGTSALAGMISIQSAEPTDEFSGYVEGGAGNFDSYDVGVALSGPLAQGLNGRIAIQQHRDDGYINNKFLDRDDVNEHDELTARAKLNWQITEKSHVSLTAFYIDLDNGYDAFSIDNNRNTFSDEPGQDDQETAALSVKFVTDLGDALSLDANLALEQTDSEYGYDEDWTFVGFDPFGYSNTDNYIRDRESETLDVRVLSQGNDQLLWLAGFSYRTRDQDLLREDFGDLRNDYETETIAVYGEVETALSDKLRLTVGLRVEQFEDEYSNSQGLDSDSSDDLWGADIQLEYSASENMLAYAQLSRGFKAGGINTDATANRGFLVDNANLATFLEDGRLRFDDESVLNFELGIKALWLEDRLNVRAAVFYMDRDNPQLEASVTGFESSGTPLDFNDDFIVFVGYLDNADGATNQGVELEASYIINDSWNIYGSLGYLDTEIEGFVAQDPALGLVDFDGRDQANAPNYQFNAGLNWQIASRWAATLEVEGRDEYFFSSNHNQTSESYELWHASITYQHDSLTVRAWGRNITDEDYAVRGFFFGNDPRDGYVPELYEQYGTPATYGVTGTYSF